jgi:hypothetical protein
MMMIQPEDVDGPGWEWYRERALDDEGFHVKLPEPKTWKYYKELPPDPDDPGLCESDCGYGPNISRCRAGHVEFTQAKSRTKCPHRDTEGKRCGEPANVSPSPYGP